MHFLLSLLQRRIRLSERVRRSNLGSGVLTRGEKCLWEFCTAEAHPRYEVSANTLWLRDFNFSIFIWLFLSPFLFCNYKILMNTTIRFLQLNSWMSLHFIFSTEQSITGLKTKLAIHQLAIFLAFNHINSWFPFVSSFFSFLFFCHILLWYA